MMANLLFSPKANADLDQIWHYSAKNWGELRAETYLRSIFEAAERLKDNPRLGRSREDVRRGYRSLIIGSHLIFYQLNQETVTVIRILHQRMDVNAII
jgi:toxin ParE1/3/4